MTLPQVPSTSRHHDALIVDLLAQADDHPGCVLLCHWAV